MEDKKHIMVVWYRPGKKAVRVKMEPTLANFQKLVDGHIQIIPVRKLDAYDAGLNIICNEEGKLKYPDQPTAWLKTDKGDIYDLLFGPFVVCGHIQCDEELGEDVYNDLTEADYKRIFKEFGV